ncbi:flagellar export chaperone FliS [Desulfofundulus thermobenzoicus]|uniref:Flagellar secretion chaperone FliS n=1 Tax=Desulfofundulus thermobenzoicus TaxID=29376 RepID=A0A6N7INE6_9FIRM|nr:flagellar export chaperone FliS [Desulfofundulus thermobenzoicus]MQL51464.1 flagellar export chaperone FliS [Desulfofundulus thermobenzoicus]
MALNNPYQQYRQNAVLTADPGRLALMLFNGAAKFTSQARSALEAGDLPGAHQKIIRAQDIMVYLLATVNDETDVGRNLAALYDYMYRRLVEANIKKDAGILNEVARMLEDLGATWQEALQKGGGPSGEMSGAATAREGAVE